MTLRFLLVLSLALLARVGFAFEPFLIKDIRVEGIQRTEAGTVFSYLPVKVGDTMTDEKAAQAIKTLFGTGFFKDVRLEIDKQVLVVVLEERPAIASLDFNGLKAFKPEDLKKGLREVGLAESRIFDRAQVERAEQELKRQYLSQGHYAVQISTTVTPLERNRVGLTFAVTEGEIAKIKQINIVGAKAFKESELLDLMVLRTPGLMTWYTKNDQYSKQKLSGDIEALRSFYLDRGYLEFNIESTAVSISPSKQDIYITINVTEGEKYTVSAVKLAGELVLAEQELRKLVQVKPGDVFSRERMTETTKAISDRLGNDGYAFANVNAAPEVDKANRKVAFTILVDPGRRVYVRRINVVGNSRTRDEVIRREVRQLESSWYDGEKVNRSKTRVDKLGYFDEVAVETPTVPGSTDQVDLALKVKEKPTGNLMLGAGFSSSEKMTVSGSVQQQNLFGSGKHLGVQANSSKSNKVYSVSYTNPYFTTEGLSQGFDVYHKKVDTSSLTTGSFGSKSTGGGVRFGYPVSEETAINLGFMLDRTQLWLDSTSPLRYQDYVNRFGDRINTGTAILGWGNDDKDSRLYPTKGGLQQAGLEVALPGSTATYTRWQLQAQQYFPVSRHVTLMLNGEVGFVRGYQGKEVPFLKNFYAGGIGSVRGFQGGTLGPQDAVSGEYLGGTSKVVINSELLFPFPGLGLDKSARLGAFIDAGNVWGYGTTTSLSDLRYSAGLSMYWSSPVGPLKFAVGAPINIKPGEKKQVFQFQMGQTF